jgi:hypothetical protein
MLASITLVVTFTSLLSLVSTSPVPDHLISQPNVTLFSLPAAITPPAGQTLQLVFQGYGIQSHSIKLTGRNTKLHLQCHKWNVLDNRNGGSQITRHYPLFLWSRALCPTANSRPPSRWNAFLRVESTGHLDHCTGIPDL